MNEDAKPVDQTYGNGKYTFEFFPENYVALNKELYSQNHPKLQAIVSQYPADEVDIKLAQIAAYCEIMLDGAYQVMERDQLCKILLERLILLREPDHSGLIVVSH